MRLLEPGFEPALSVGRLSVGRFGVPAAPEVDRAVETALNATSWTVTELDPLPWRTATRATAILLSAEAFQANRSLFETSGDRLSPDVARRLADGRRVTGANLSDAHRVRVSWQSRLRKLFHRFDLLVTPTLAILPPRLDQADQLLTMRYTLPVNLAGVPAVALQVPARGRLPASIQLIASWGREEQLLAAAAVIEAAVG
jgi:Asp-tRNA(Asn)/Glu-tRNA(Gln) amidotransferase A subunit family amidase